MVKDRTSISVTMCCTNGMKEMGNHFEDFLGLVKISSGAKRKVERKKSKKIKNE